MLDARRLHNVLHPMPDHCKSTIRIELHDDGFSRTKTCVMEIAGPVVRDRVFTADVMIEAMRGPENAIAPVLRQKQVQVMRLLMEAMHVEIERFRVWLDKYDPADKEGKVDSD